MFHADQDRVQREAPVKNSLYSPAFEHDNCGIGAVVNIKGFKSHATVENALNAWTKPTDGRTYYSWQQDNINNAPTFATGAKSKNKRKR